MRRRQCGGGSSVVDNKFTWSSRLTRNCMIVLNCIRTYLILLSLVSVVSSLRAFWELMTLLQVISSYRYQLAQDNPESNWNSFSWLKKFQNQTGIRILSNSSFILEKNIVTKINVQNETGKRVAWLIMWQQTPGLAWFWFQFQSGISKLHYLHLSDSYNSTNS